MPRRLKKSCSGPVVEKQRKREKTSKKSRKCFEEKAVEAKDQTYEPSWWVLMLHDVYMYFLEVWGCVLEIESLCFFKVRFSLRARYDLSKFHCDPRYRHVFLSTL